MKMIFGEHEGTGRLDFCGFTRVPEKKITPKPTGQMMGAC